MDNRKLGILAGVAAAMVLWAVVQARWAAGERTRPASGPAYLVQGLDPASIRSITVGAGEKAVKIDRRNGQFVVTNKSDYPADTKQINDLITKVLDIQTTDFYTGNPKNQEDLGITEKKARAVVKFFKDDGALLTGVVVGASQDEGSGTYVRLVDSNEVYVTANAPWFRSGALEYVNQEIVNVKREDVNSVTVRTPEGSYVLKPGKGSDAVAMEGMPADQKLKDSDARAVLTGLTSLRFDDVNQPSQVPGLTFDHEYTCRLNNSTEYRFKLAKKGTKTYLLASAAYTDPTKVTINTSQVDSPEELKKKEAILLAQENAQKFTLRHKDWIYEIPDWKAKSLTKKQADLLEAKAKPAEATTPATPTPAPAPKPADVKPAEPAQPVVAPAPAPTLPAPAVQPAESNQPAPAVQPAAPTQSTPLAAPPEPNQAPRVTPAPAPSTTPAKE
jgi:hypothetical protein